MHVPCFPPHLCLRLPFVPLLVCATDTRCHGRRPPPCPPLSRDGSRVSPATRPTLATCSGRDGVGRLGERHGGACVAGQGRPRHMLPCRPAPYTDTLCCLLRQGCQPPTPATRRATRTTQPTPQKGWPTASKALDAGLPRPSCNACLRMLHQYFTCCLICMRCSACSLAHCAHSHIPPCFHFILLFCCLFWLLTCEPGAVQQRATTRLLSFLPPPPPFFVLFLFRFIFSFFILFL